MNLDLHWHPDPGVLDGLFVICVLYAMAVGPLRRYLAPPGTPLPRVQIAWFGLGVLTLCLAVATPLDQISEQYLFSAHMLQHVLLVYPLPIFWLLGTPGWLISPFLRTELTGPVLRFLTRPVVAFALFNLLFYIWHLPALYEWALRDSKIHFLEHATFIAGSLLVWMPLLSPTPDLPRLHPGGQLLLLLAGSIAQMPLFGFLTFGQTVFYPTYRTAERICWLDPLGDQQLGGIIMKISAMLIMFGAVVVVLSNWVRSERRPNPRPVTPPAPVSH